MPRAHHLPEAVRWYLYVASAALAGAWAVIQENADIHWGWAAAYSAFVICVNLLAASNTGTTDYVKQAELQQNIARQMRFLENEG